MADLLSIARRPNLASEKTVESRCDDLVAKISGKEAVVRFSQARETHQTEGIPDRRYRPFGVCLWFEVKSEKADAQLTRHQAEFLRAELAGGELAACGTTTELVQVLDAIRTDLFGKEPDGHALAVCERIVQDWEGRGFRGEKKPRQPKKEKTRE